MKNFWIINVCELPVFIPHTTHYSLNKKLSNLELWPSSIGFFPYYNHHGSSGSSTYIISFTSLGQGGWRLKLFWRILELNEYLVRKWNCEERYVKEIWNLFLKRCIHRCSGFHFCISQLFDNWILSSGNSKIARNFRSWIGNLSLLF